MQTLCPNCQQRPPDTRVDYDEVVRSRYHVSRSRVRGARWSFASTTEYGHTDLCARCATRYQRMVQWRTLGWKMANRGFISLTLGAVVSLLVLETPVLKNSVLIYVAGAVVLLAVLAILGGSIVVIGARIRRPSVTRFLLSIPSEVTTHAGSRVLFDR